MSIDYDHARNRHSIEGAAVAFSVVLSCLPALPRRLIDVGCGTGVWLRAAMEAGVEELLGVDGIIADPDRLVVPASLIVQHDLTTVLEVGRRFDVALCLEVAEHLDVRHAPLLIESLVSLADTVVFSAACPGQRGQHHVNCQWPEYWQHLFNSHGFRCDDDVRWKAWSVGVIEPWYRQNMFIAIRDPVKAGQEDRIVAVRHPEIFGDPDALLAEQMLRIASGGMRITWYVQIALKAVGAKLARLARRLRSSQK